MGAISNKCRIITPSPHPHRDLSVKVKYLSCQLRSKEFMLQPPCGNKQSLSQYSIQSTTAFSPIQKVVNEKTKYYLKHAQKLYTSPFYTNKCLNTMSNSEKNHGKYYASKRLQRRVQQSNVVNTLQYIYLSKEIKKKLLPNKNPTTACNEPRPLGNFVHIKQILETRTFKIAPVKRHAPSNTLNRLYCKDLDCRQQKL